MLCYLNLNLYYIMTSSMVHDQGNYIAYLCDGYGHKL